MHLTLHEVIANQPWVGDPAISWQTVERLTGLRYNRHELLHMLVGVMSAEIRKSLQPRRPDVIGYAETRQEPWGSERRRRGRHDR